MSVVDEDTELRDILVQTLDKNGVLGKIKAELRSSIFLALETQDHVKDSAPLANKKLNSFLTDGDGQICIDVIHDFLEFFNLDYTSAVFLPETNTSNQTPHKKLCQKLKIAKSEESQHLPVLTSLVQERIKNTLSDSQVRRAQSLFMEHCRIGSDTISQLSAVNVLSKLNPKFPSFLLERFVTEEIGSLPGVSSRTFIQMYEKLFAACHSFVVDDSISTSPSSSNEDLRNTEDELIQQTIGIPEKQPEESSRSNESQKHSISSKEGLPVDYLKPAMNPNDTMDVSYDQFFDDDIYSKPKELPQTFMDSTTGTGKLPPLVQSGSKTYGASKESDWHPSDNNPVHSIGKKQNSLDYEDDFNTTSHASITEDIQEGSSLLSSDGSGAELTDDRSISERRFDQADYMEDVKKF